MLKPGVAKTCCRVVWAWLKKYWPYLAIFFIVAVISYHNYDPDFGWHLRSGEYFFHNGVPKTDIYTYTASDFPWVDHEWLSDIMVYGLYSLGGYDLLIVVYSFLWSLGIYFVSRARKPRWLIFLAGLGMIPYVGVRTMTLAVFFSGLLYLIVNSEKISKWLAVPLFLLWANMHGSFPLGLVYLAYVAIRYKSWRWVLIAVVSFVATFGTVYGVHTYTEIFRTMFDPDLKSNIQEWKSFDLKSSLIPYLSCWISIMILSNGKKWRNYLRFDTLLLLAALSSTRHTPLFILFSLPQMLDYVGAIPKLKIHRQDRNLFAVVGIIILIGLGSLVWLARGIISGDRESKYAPMAVNYLEGHGCSGGNLFNYYDVGGYLIWKAPNTKVYIDGRGPSWRNGDVHYMADYNKIVDDKVFREEEFQKYNIRCVLWLSGRDFVKELTDSGWRIVPEASGKYVFLEK